jgi:hypothetical protein
MVSLSGSPPLTKRAKQTRQATTWLAVVSVVLISAAPASLWLMMHALATAPPGYSEEEAFELSGKIAIVFKEPAEVTMEQPGPVLRLTFFNSRFDPLSPDDQRAKARAIARFAVNNIPDARHVRGVVVQFAQQPMLPGLSDQPPTIRKYIFLRSQLR